VRKLYSVTGVKKMHAPIGEYGYIFGSRCLDMFMLNLSCEKLMKVIPSRERRNELLSETKVVHVV
jgi:hypothetical protein